MQRRKHIIVLLHPEDGEYTLLTVSRHGATSDKTGMFITSFLNIHSETIRGHQSLYLVAQSLIPGVVWFVSGFDSGFRIRQAVRLDTSLIVVVTKCYHIRNMDT